jgi:spore maturation protein CgeB
MKSYKDKVEFLKQEISAIENELRENVYKIINEVASEQKLNRVSKHCFIVSFSDLTNKPWDSVFHDWERSAEMLIKKLEAQQALNIYDYLINLYEKRTKNNTCSFKYRMIYKCHAFNMYEDVTQVLDGNFIKRIIDRLDGLE